MASHQVAKELELEKSYRVEYVQAHKAAQAEYLADGGEVINHLLMLDDYASSSQETSGWCLLVPKRGGRKGRGSQGGGKGLGGSQLLPELTGVSPGTAVANMSAEQRAALRAALEAAEEEES